MELETAKKLAQGSWVHNNSKNNRDGTPVRYKVTSVKTWKRHPERVLVHLKYGLRTFLTADENEIKYIEVGNGIQPKGE